MSYRSIEPRRDSLRGRHRRLVVLSQRLFTAVLLVTTACSSGSSPQGAGDNPSSGGARAGGKGGSPVSGAGGVPGAAGAPSGSGGAANSGGAAGAPDAASPAADAGNPVAGSGGGDQNDGSAPTDATASDAGGGPSSCGLAGQTCCPGNTCIAPARPSGGAGGTTVLELHASGGDPYALFGSKNLLPIDGPDSGYITDTGTSFLFVLHEDGAEETVSSGAKRQRNEVTVNPPNPAIYKGVKGDTLIYSWRFRLDKMNANPTWCDIFQVKQHGPLGVAPYMAFEANKSELTIDTEKLGVVRRIPLSTIMGIWINASVTVKFGDVGALALLLKKDDGSTVMSFSNDNVRTWDATVDFVRPKWGLYRNKAAGAGEAAIQYNDMKITRVAGGGVMAPPGGTCSCGQ